MHSVSAVTVFCGSRTGEDPSHAEGAARLGRLLADNGIKLIYGGGGIGLMGVVAQAAREAGGQVTGVIPEFLMQYEVGHVEGSEVVVVDSMHDRKRRMFELSDGFIVLPGGLGTLDETIEVITWKQLQLHDKPIVIINNNGYWDPFLALVDQVVEQGYGHSRVRDLYVVADSFDAALDALYNAPEVDEEVLTSHL